jgi:hypothetical protein
MSANAKLILYNEMRELRLPPAQSPVEPGRAKLGTSLLLSAANLPLLLGTGIVFCQAGDAKVYKARADVAAPQCDRDGTERNGPYPQV